MEGTFDWLSFSKNPKITNLFEVDESLLFSDVIYKFNSMDWKQQRNIMITNKYIYNLKGENIKRKIKFKDIIALTISGDSNSEEFIIHVPSEYDYFYSSEK